MYRTVLIPLDGSPEAERPIASVSAMARSAGDPVRIIVSRSAGLPRAEEGETGPAHVRAMEEAEGYLRTVAAPLSHAGLDVTAITSYGGAAETISTQITAQNVDLMAMATHGRWGVDRLMHGSLAEEVVADTSVPVMLFGPESRSTGPIRSMLLPLDGGPFTAAVLPEAGRFARSFGVEQLDLLAILPPQTVHVDDLEGSPPAWALERMGVRAIGNSSYALDDQQPAVRERIAELEHALEYWSDWLRVSGAQVRIHARYELSGRGTAGSILAAATELGSDLVLMRTHARRGISRALTGSVADAVVRTSPLPVLLYTTATLEALSSSTPSATVEIQISS